MKWLVLVLVVLVWVSLTTAAAALVPEREDDKPDLAFDPHWHLNIPTDPVEPDKLPPRPTTTKAPPPPPRRVVLPRPAPTTPPAPRVRTPGGVEQWRDEVSAYGDWNTDLMLSIMGCESGGRADADNPHSTANGLFQILGGSFDPIANIAQAHTMWSTRGTQPWNSSRSCWG